MNRAITLAALTCLLLAGAAMTAILGRDTLPAMPAGLAAAPAADSGPVANRASKQDKLAVAALATAAFEPAAAAAAQPPAPPSPLQLRAQANIPGAPDTLRQAYASVEPTDVGLPKLTDPAEVAPKITDQPVHAPAVAAPPKPKAAAKPAPQKSYTLLSDAQIANIKERLKLSSDQEYYWPAVETALRAVARKIHSKRQGDVAAGSVPIDPDSAEVQQLKSAAMPLLFQLREDQKNEVRSLARLIGLEKVAAMI
ncbi:hypothetical protein J6500_21430 [Bradyrhizobium sp. WSM 1704]|uniref:hypothetical protein n=1 Tax=Bradyrhizobium semiaridum TaxID=2821404 RepID=UPI001CE31580|nr:hypothetical protein [Bradyrhizobium semiaridum]MCA6124433.1 hypothetical protein [Bradyrhizobium semiaridum]